MHPHLSIFCRSTIPTAQSGIGSGVTRGTPPPTWMQRSTLDAEVLSALGRLHRAGDLDAGTVETKLHELAAAPIQRHAVNDLCSAHGPDAVGYGWSTRCTSNWLYAGASRW